MSNIDKIKKIKRDLTPQIQGPVYTDIIRRAAYSSDASIYQILPLAVVAPANADDVVKIVKYARDNNLPIAPRGAGSGLAGESLTPGIMIDTRQKMDKVLKIADDASTVKCQPGLVLDELNELLASQGRKIGPDPSSANRATIGGVVANNATGSHSLQYGYIAEYIERIQVVSSDGDLLELTNDMSLDSSSTEPAQKLVNRCYELLRDKGDLIQSAQPATKRNRCGYNIHAIVHDGKIDMAKLIAGSEGTLAIITSVTLKTVPLPAVKALCQMHFATRANMAKAVPLITATNPAACELMDRTLMDIAANALPQYKDLFPTDAQAILLIEHVAENQDQLTQKIDATIKAVGHLAAATHRVFDHVEQQRLWKSRKDAVPLLYRQKGNAHPVAFMEDTSVENIKLADYIVGLEKIAEKYDVTMAYYGHAGDGELHVRPRLDLHQQSDRKKMIDIAEEVFRLAWSLGGSISGEHADGIVRTGFIKKQYGSEYYQLLRDIKNIFDPAKIMNPGKIINDDPDAMIDNLRAQFDYLDERLKTELIFGTNEFRDELDQCNGCGVCLSKSGGRMCPVFKALGEELASSRAKVNVLRLWAKGLLTNSDFESAEFEKFLALCTGCKACSVDCPSGVDVGLLMAAARAEYNKRKRIRPATLMMSRNRLAAGLLSRFSTIVNFAANLNISRWFMQKFSPIASQRSLPAFAKGSFVKKAQKYLANSAPIAQPIDRVAYFLDVYANYNDHDLASAVLDIFAANNIDVIVPLQTPAPLAAIVYGDAKFAKKELAYNLKELARAVTDGRKIICSEPSAALCLQKDLTHFVPDDEAKLVAENTHELMTYLLTLHKQNKLKKPQNTEPQKYLYHTPCHLQAINNARSTTELFKQLLDSDVTDINAGCCGLSGTFGMLKKNYPLSEKIGQPLKEVIKKHPNTTIITECSACAMQLKHLGAKKVLHPAQVLANAYTQPK
jgi:FAD/FMN-containing dehydrogenase/Fe-S oxidoreductase